MMDAFIKVISIVRVTIGDVIVFNWFHMCQRPVHTISFQMPDVLVYFACWISICCHDAIWPLVKIRTKQQTQKLNGTNSKIATIISMETRNTHCVCQIFSRKITAAFLTTNTQFLSQPYGHAPKTDSYSGLPKNVQQKTTTQFKITIIISWNLYKPITSMRFVRLRWPISSSHLVCKFKQWDWLSLVPPI